MSSRKPYMPLMVGDWLKGTRGMRAECRGIYLGLLLHQWENGWVPDTIEELALIEPEVGKVWDSPKDRLREKFTELSTGRLQNRKLEDVRAFWAKQSKNGLLGGRPKKEKPNETQTVTQNEPKAYPKREPSYDLDIDHDHELNTGGGGAGGGGHDPRSLKDRLAAALDEQTIENASMKGRTIYPGIDIPMETQRFIVKVLDAPDFYKDHTAGGLRMAYHKHLRDAKPSTTKTTTNGNRKQLHTDTIIAEYYARHGGAGVS